MGSLEEPGRLEGRAAFGAAVIVISYFVASGNDFKIVNLDTGGYFEHWETVLADASILVAYVAGAGAVLTAIYSEVANTRK